MKRWRNLPEKWSERTKSWKIWVKRWDMIVVLHVFIEGLERENWKKKLEEIKDTFTHTFLTFPTLQTTKALWVQSRLNKHMSGSVIKHIFLILQNTKEQERMLKDSRNGSGIGNWPQRWFLEDKRMMPSWFGRNFDSVPNKLQIQYEGKIKAF